MSDSVCPESQRLANSIGNRGWSKGGASTCHSGSPRRVRNPPAFPGFGWSG